MITLLLHVFRLLPLLFGGHRQLALENLALRQQLAVYKRTMPRPRLHAMDRLFWVGLARVWTGGRQALVIISPDTVLRWQRRRFREYWTQLSGRHSGGRPRISAEIAALIRKMVAANPLWGAPRIHGELLKLGIDVAERTVSRLLPKRRFGPSQTWRTFLANHLLDLLLELDARGPTPPRRPTRTDQEEILGVRPTHRSFQHRRILSEWDLDASAFVVKEIIIPVASGISTGLPRTGPGATRVWAARKADGNERERSVVEHDVE